LEAGKTFPEEADCMKLRWDIQHVYLYLVSFIAMILLIVGAVNLTQTAIAYLTPVPEDYKYLFDEAGMKDWKEEFSPALVQQERERFEAVARENSQRNLLRDLIGSLAYIVIALPVYLYHWRKIPQLEEG
jgi:predicted permease